MATPTFPKLNFHQIKSIADRVRDAREKCRSTKTFVSIAKLKSIQILLVLACVWKFKLFQMDVKSVFLNGILNKEVHVKQLKGFQDPWHPNHVYRLRKALYGLKQAPKAWHERLTSYLLKK